MLRPKSYVLEAQSQAWECIYARHEGFFSAVILFPRTFVSEEEIFNSVLEFSTSCLVTFHGENAEKIQSDDFYLQNLIFFQCPLRF